MLILIISYIDGELVNMKDCMAYGQGAAPSEENPT